jgi:hypothetical protein
MVNPMVSTNVVFDAKATLKALRELDPGLRKEMIREFKSEAKPLVKDIKDSVKSLTPPVGSLNSSGRLSWVSGLYKGNRIKPDNVIAKLSSGRSRRSAVTSLFGVWVRSPMPALMGVIGKGSMSPRRAETKEYEWNGTKRSHKNNGQGVKLLAFVQHRNSNWFYRAAEKAMPDVERKVKLVWDKYSSKVSRKL